GSCHSSPLPPAGGVGGGQRGCVMPTPLRLTSKLVSLTAPPACGRGNQTSASTPKPTTLNLPPHAQEEAPAEIVILRPERRRLADHRRGRGHDGRDARRRGIEQVGDPQRDPEAVGDV